MRGNGATPWRFRLGVLVSNLVLRRFRLGVSALEPSLAGYELEGLALEL